MLNHLSGAFLKHAYLSIWFNILTRWTSNHNPKLQKGIWTTKIELVWRILPFHNVDAGLAERVFEREEEQGTWRSRVSSSGLQFLELLPLLSLQFFFIHDERGQSCHTTAAATTTTTWLHFESPKCKTFLFPQKRMELYPKTWNEIPSLANPWSP